MDKPEITHKTCSKCGEVKEVGEFHKNRSRSDGLNCYCNVCKSAKNKAYKEANPKKYMETRKAWVKANLEKVKALEKASHKRAYERNPEKVNAGNKNWAKANPEKAKELSKNWAKANPEKVKAKHKLVRMKITDSYIASQLKIPVAQLTPDLAELKRLEITIKRSIKAANQALTQKEKS